MKTFLRAVLTASALLTSIFPTLSIAQVWIIPVEGGEMRFDDWGYVGPKGRGAMDFAPINGFGGSAEGNFLDPSGGVGQVQTVMTLDPDWLTSDPAYTVRGDVLNVNLPVFSNANMDGTVNFYKWGYTTVAGSTFNNMRIDYDGDYLVKRSDMKFMMYDTFIYKDTTGTNPDQIYATNIKFQPYALSDAIGWCGSVLASHPLALESMAGQVKFDVGFSVFLFFNPDVGQLQIIPGFVMRSYGSLEISAPNINLPFKANAVVNNTDPALGHDATHPMGFVNPAYYNRVSFMGGGVVPSGAWIYPGATGPTDLRVHPVQGANGSSGQVRADGAVWYTNAFAGYPFLLRADGNRTVTYFDANRYGPDPMSPVSKDVRIDTVTEKIVTWQPVVSDPNGDPLSCRIGTPSQNGVASVASDCSSGKYQSNLGFVGIDNFTYIANDGRLDSLPGIVTVSVVEPPPSDPCLAKYPVSEFSQTGKDGTLTITFTGNVAAHNNKEVKVCPGTGLSYKAVSTRGAVVCKIKNNSTRGAGGLRINDHLKCTDKPAGKDKVYIKVKSGIS